MMYAADAAFEMRHSNSEQLSRLSDGVAMIATRGHTSCLLDHIMNCISHDSLPGLTLT